MRALLQRVTHASVAVNKKTVGSIRQGLLVLVGVSRNDGDDDARYIVDKTLNVRVFRDDGGEFDCSALNIGAELLVVSQFTLYSDTRRGRRPSFTEAAPPEHAEILINQVVQLFRESGLVVETGRFRSDMLVSIYNDGPVTIMLDSLDKNRPRRN